MPEDDQVTLEVFDLTGKLLQTLYRGDVEAGQEYSFDFEAGNHPTGIYIYRLTANDGVYTGKMKCTARNPPHTVTLRSGTKTHTKPPAGGTPPHGLENPTPPALSSTISSFTTVQEELLRLTAGGAHTPTGGFDCAQPP
jgi:hypothetical protein